MFGKQDYPIASLLLIHHIASFLLSEYMFTHMLFNVRNTELSYCFVFAIDSSYNFFAIFRVQVRRTDKVTAREAKFHGVEEYMTHVEDWFDTYEQTHPGVERLVYLATDEAKVIKEAEKK